MNEVMLRTNGVKTLVLEFGTPRTSSPTNTYILSP